MYYSVLTTPLGRAMITEISKYLLKVKNKDVVVLVSLLFNFEHISYLFLVFLFACFK